MCKGEKVIKVSLVGCGWVAWREHLPVLTKLPQCKVVAVCDKDEQVVARTARFFRVDRFYADVAKMLNETELDLVDICSPPDTHANIAILALNKGCNCLIEKPFTTHLEDALKIKNIAMSKGLSLHVIHNYSFYLCAMKAKSLLGSGQVGEVFDVSVKFLRQKSFVSYRGYDSPHHWCQSLPGGIFGELLPHPLMLVLEFLDEPIEQIEVLNANLSSTSADELRILLKGNHKMGELAFSLNAPISLSTVELSCTKGLLHFDLDWNSLLIYPQTEFDESLRYRFTKFLYASKNLLMSAGSVTRTSAQTFLGRGFSPHKFLIEKSIQSLLGIDAYPVNLDKCMELVDVSEKIFSQMARND